MKMVTPLSFGVVSGFLAVLLVLALLLPCLISLTRCASYSDLTASSIFLFRYKQSSVLCPLSVWKSQYLFLFLDSCAPDIGGGVIKVPFSSSMEIYENLAASTVAPSFGLVSCCFFSPNESFVTLIISSTILGILSLSLLINHGRVIPCMNPKILMSSGAPLYIKLLLVKRSMKA
ncbi:hypothetical protein Tco_1139343 [Tanacetum coccineum]